MKLNNISNFSHDIEYMQNEINKLENLVKEKKNNIKNERNDITNLFLLKQHFYILELIYKNDDIELIDKFREILIKLWELDKNKLYTNTNILKKKNDFLLILDKDLDRIKNILDPKIDEISEIENLIKWKKIEIEKISENIVNKIKVSSVWELFLSKIYSILKF